MNRQHDKLFSGEEKPRNIPEHWHGEALPECAGWRWFNPDNRGDSVRIYRGSADSESPAEQQPYVIVTVDSQLIGRDGKPTGKILND